MAGNITLSLILAVLVGLALGAVGGGGSILALPILVFVSGVPAQEAVPMSMVIVGATSLLGAILHRRTGSFHFKAMVLFAATGMIGSYGGSALTRLVPPRALLGIFSTLMLLTGIAMIRGRSWGDVTQTCRVWPCLLIGASVGALTGFLGVGGGFVIVPALVLLAGIETKAAIGTSLAIISLNAAAGLIGQLRHVSIDWQLTLGFTAAAVAGMLGGFAIARKTTAQQLSRAFGWLVIVLAIVVGSLTAAGFQNQSMT